MKEERIEMYINNAKDIKLLTCQNIWLKDHKELIHKLTYEIEYKNGKIEHVQMTTDSPFPVNHFGISEDLYYYCGQKPVKYLNLSTPENRVEIKDVKCTVIKDPDPVEMTVEEIEAALGKKIKIVSKE